MWYNQDHTWTLNMEGEWAPVKTASFRAFGLYLAHHTLAALIQKSCDWEYARPGSKGLGPWRLVQEAAKNWWISFFYKLFENLL